MQYINIYPFYPQKYTLRDNIFLNKLTLKVPNNILGTPFCSLIVISLFYQFPAVKNLNLQEIK